MPASLLPLTGGGGGGLYKLEFLHFKFCTKILYAIGSVFLRICAGNNSKRPLFLMSNYWEPYIICSLIFKKGHRFCRARICRFIFSPTQNPPPPRYRCPFLQPVPSLGMPISLSLPFALPLAVYLTFLLPLVGCANPDCPCFTALCQIHTEEGNDPRHWLGVSKRTTHTAGRETLPNSGFWALDVHLQGHFLTGAHNNLQPALSCAQSSL